VAAASSAGPRGSQVGQDLRSPQIRCYHCQGIFTTAVARQPQLHHVRCPYCSTINGVPSQNMPIPTLNATMANMGDLSPATMQRQEQLLRRLQAREITPLVREPFVSFDPALRALAIPTQLPTRRFSAVQAFTHSHHPTHPSALLHTRK